MLIDSHCHINDDMYINNPKDYVKKSNDNGVNVLLVVGYDLKSSEQALAIAEKFENVYAAVGIIPAEVKNAKKEDLSKIEELLSNKKVIAIGEIGLDYYWDKEENVKYSQREYFIYQIGLANKYNLPVSIHCRDAYEDLVKILKEHPVNKKGVIHCFSSSVEIANELIKLGYCLGFGGTSTFKNSVKVKEVLRTVNSKNYMLETDAPYLTPEPHRGKPNHSMYLKHIRDNAALLRNETPDQIEKDTTENFCRVFGIWKNK